MRGFIPGKAIPPPAPPRPFAASGDDEHYADLRDEAEELTRGKVPEFAQAAELWDELLEQIDFQGGTWYLRDAAGEDWEEVPRFQVEDVLFNDFAVGSRPRFERVNPNDPDSAMKRIPDFQREWVIKLFKQRH